MKNRNFVFLMLAATLVSFIVSVWLWFFRENQLEAIFVGIWVPWYYLSLHYCRLQKNEFRNYSYYSFFNSVLTSCRSNIYLYSI